MTVSFTRIRLEAALSGPDSLVFVYFCFCVWRFSFSSSFLSFLRQCHFFSLDAGDKLELSRLDDSLSSLSSNDSSSTYSFDYSEKELCSLFLCFFGDSLRGRSRYFWDSLLLGSISVILEPSPVSSFGILFSCLDWRDIGVDSSFSFPICLSGIDAISLFDVVPPAN